MLLSGGSLKTFNELAVLLGSFLLKLPHKSAELPKLGVHGGDLVAEALRHASDPLADRVGQAAYPFGNKLVNRVDLGFKRRDDGPKAFVEVFLGAVHPYVDGRTPMLELSRAGLQPAVKTLTGCVDDLLNDARNLSIVTGTTDIAGNDGAETGGHEDGDQEGNHEYWLHEPNTTKEV